MVDKTNHASKLEALLDAAVDSIITIDCNGIVQSVNPATEKLFGFAAEEIIGKNINRLMPEPYASEHDGYLHQHQVTGETKIIGIGREVEGKRKDGSVFHMHLSVSKYTIEDEIFYTGIIHDLTSRKHAETALAKSQKLEAIGQLTGGIAHDFNNLLTVITGNLEFLEMKLNDPVQLDLLKEAQEAAEMGSDLTNRLLAFARRSILQPQPTDINAQVSSMANMISRTIGGNVEFKLALDDELWTAKVDPGQFESVLLNLAVNARDAMPDGGGLVVETSNFFIDDEYLSQEAGIEKGNYVKVSVSDTGAGIPASVLENVFEPFFTTKETGRGTGLGLSMVYGFAKQSGGHANIYSELGVGTTVNIYLPKDYGESEAVVRKSDKEGLKPGNQEMILVVEDDPKVQRLSVQRLEALNYRSITANNGIEALEILAANDEIDLVFSDLVMPGGLSGYELAELVKQKYPNIPVLMTSGYAEDLVHAERLNDHTIDLLRKPYKLGELAIALEKLLF